MLLSKSEFIYLVVIIGATFLILSIFFISVLVINTRNRRQKQIEMLQAMLNIQENERTRIASDLHDDIGVMVSGIKLMINSFPDDAPDNLKSIVKETSVNLDKVFNEIRIIIRNLSPTKIKELGLVGSIEDFRKIVERSGRFQFNFIHDGIDESWGENAEINIYRIIHEMINNSLKHSNGNLITLSMQMKDGHLKIIYSDNGTVTKMKKDSGMGIQNIEQRVKMLKGEISPLKDFRHGALYHILFDNKNLVAS
jgi:signal transduction histidine kinase